MEKPLKLICNWHVTYMSLLRAGCAILSLSKTHIGNQTGGNGWGVRISHGTEKKGLPAVERMRTYEAGKWITPLPGIRVLPLYVDHSALDSYMFYIQVSEKSILFTGDFQEHGIVGQRGRLERVLKTCVPGPVDVLITEGTMLSRLGETKDVLVKSELERDGIGCHDLL